ncbi:MAG: preprotein translocase subunit YajC [Actinomycetota bacterium]|jgi:preprotein translocase subunit YajC|nr:preprotein translocase subunit YajC [Actinomycetota bacterium]
MGAAVDQLLFFALLLAAGWFLLIRPQRKRYKAMQDVRSAVQVGSAVITTAGLHARVTAVEDDTVLLEIAPGVQARFATQAVVRVLEPAETPAGEQAAPPAH